MVSKMEDNFKIKRMSQKEVAEIAIEWAAKEGWNPGLYDAACFYAADPHGFLIGELDGEPVAIISAVAYDELFGFLGFYIVKPEFRHRGYGILIWNAALDYLGDRNVGGNGVIERISDYQTQGFKAYYKNRRYQGIGQGRLASNSLIEIQKVDFKKLALYDDGIFPAKRHKFLKCWISQPQTKGYALLDSDRLTGYGVVRPCQNGYKIGPLFADNAAIAKKIFNRLAGEVPLGWEYFFDVSEINTEAINLAERYCVKIIFETARIYSKSAPSIPLEKVYGVTSLELG